MIYSAKVIQAGTDAGTWIVSPAYTTIDGLPAKNILALSSDGIVPAVDDIVLCCEGINPFDHSSVRSFDKNGGSNPIIIATFAQVFKTLCNVILGQGTDPMVLGNKLATWAESVDSAVSALITWAKTGTGSSGSIPAIFPVPTDPEWSDENLSENHKLD
jgi:hypothetical protein